MPDKSCKKLIGESVMRILMLLIGLVAISSAYAGEWSYRCGYLGSNSSANCEQISDAAASAVTEGFVKKYPQSKYLINFSVDSSFYSDKGLQTYTVIASLHRKLSKDGRNLEFPAISAHTGSGYSQNPTYALQRENLLEAAKVAMQELVSDVMNR
jgi:hypothetical protein